MEKLTVKNGIRSLDEFIKTQGLSDWPLACDEDLDEASCHLLRQSAETHADLKARVCFPSTESLDFDLQMLWMKIRLHNSIFTHESL